MTIADDHAPYHATFTPSVVQSMRAALSDAWQALAAEGLRLEGSAKHAVFEILATGIVQTAELGERDERRMRDAALARYARQRLP
jgi:hypothetical protein